ncbi:glycosyltransferase family 4 protein [Candidatus Pacearchaeota archaeon]|nr:glycosyltransferase family 4 protein [Candidatus Pacearchaeota archaeon]
MKFISFKKNKVLIILNSLLINAGVERRTLELMIYLREKDYDVEVCVLRKLIRERVEVYQAKGFVVHFIPVYYSKKGQKTRGYVKNFLKFYRFLFAQKYGIILCAQPISHYFGRLASFPPMGRKIVAMERGGPIHRRPRKKLLLDWLCAKWTHKIVCVSIYLRDVIVNKARIKPEKVIVIEDGIRKEPVQDLQNKLRERIADRFVFGNMGMLIPTKRQSVLIRAFSLILGVHPNCILILVGGGEDERKLKELVEQLKLEDSVIFTGHQQYPHDFYPLFDAFVFPSVIEGFPNAVVEAWLHFLPVICANLRPMNDYVKHNYNGLLFETDNEETLAEKMKQLIGKKELIMKLGQNGRKTAEKKFDFNTQLRKIEAVLVPD